MRLKGEIRAYGQPEVRGCVISSLTRDGKRAFQSMPIEAKFDVKLAIGAGSIAVFRIECELPKGSYETVRAATDDDDLGVVFIRDRS